jgi:hypothetical protein
MSSATTDNIPFASPRKAALELESQFRASPYRAVRQLACHFDRGRTIIRGTVPSYYLKQVAESLAGKVVGEGNVESDIDVSVE